MQNNFGQDLTSIKNKSKTISLRAKLQKLPKPDTKNLSFDFVMKSYHLSSMSMTSYAFAKDIFG